MTQATSSAWCPPVLNSDRLSGGLGDGEGSDPRVLQVPRNTATQYSAPSRNGVLHSRSAQRSSSRPQSRVRAPRGTHSNHVQMLLCWHGGLPLWETAAV